MKLKEAQTEALIRANSTGINQVIVKVAHKHWVYTERQYPRGYLELVEPCKISETTAENTDEQSTIEPEKVKTRVKKNG